VQNRLNQSPYAPLFFVEHALQFGQLIDPHSTLLQQISVQQSS